MILPHIGGPSNLAFEKMLADTQSLQYLILYFPGDLQEEAVAAASSGLKKNTTLRELTLDFSRGTATVSPLLTSLRDHFLLRMLCLRGHVVDLTGLETVLQCETSKITELDIGRFCNGLPMVGLTRVLQALERRPTLTKLGLRWCALGREEARLLGTVMRNSPSLQSLDLACSDLGSTGLEELALALYRNTSIKELDLSGNNLDDMESAGLLREILRRNKTITTLALSDNRFGYTDGAIERIAVGLGSNSTLLKIDLSRCCLRDVGVSTLAPSLGSRNTTLQKLTLADNAITFTGVGVLLETIEQSSHHITDLRLEQNSIENEGASLVAVALENNALPKLTRLCLSYCAIDDDGFIALVSALEQNTSLLQLDLRNNPGVSPRAFLALAESLPKIKVLQGVELTGCTHVGLATAMPLLLAGLRKNTSVFRFHVVSFAHPFIRTADAEGWMQEMERLGYRNRFRQLTRALNESLPPCGVLSHALARVANLPDVIFEVLCSKPSLVPSLYSL
jgi:Ran GTPase-activating protein (RanGAP) involved in mRNA processing and transport